MSDFLSRLNPAERRFVVAVGLLFFIVVNVFWVWPHFGDWGRTRLRMDKALRTQKMFEGEIAQTPALSAKVRALQSTGLNVPPEDQAIQLGRVVIQQAGQSGLQFNGSPRSPATTTNQFFIEQTHTINVLGDDAQLVNFLYNLGAGNSLIRVRDLSVTPDPTRQRLSAHITLVASYQKKPTVKSTAPAANTPTAKPAKTPPAATAPKPLSFPAPAKQPATPQKK
jgi:hypothetical protein